MLDIYVNGVQVLGWGENVISATWYYPKDSYQHMHYMVLPWKPWINLVCYDTWFQRDYSNPSTLCTCFKISYLATPTPTILLSVWCCLNSGWHREREQECGSRWELFQKEWRQERACTCPQPTNPTTCTPSPQDAHPWAATVSLRAPGRNYVPGRIVHLIRNEHPQQITLKLNSTYKIKGNKYKPHKWDWKKSLRVDMHLPTSKQALRAWPEFIFLSQDRGPRIPGRNRVERQWGWEWGRMCVCEYT